MSAMIIDEEVNQGHERTFDRRMFIALIGVQLPRSDQHFFERDFLILA
jgi:hypothetical protein